jgi:16S rRNA (guanine966-N2)-methyltransferase
MTRIVAGAARGRRLAVPPVGTRPTSERAREALFNSLATLIQLDGARVLDLYAGSGGIGLEALSRGAVEVVFVESEPAALAVLDRNISAVGLPGARVIRRSVQTYLASPPDEPFDFVFADPPYDLADSFVAGNLDALKRAGWTQVGGVVVIERSGRTPEPVWPDPLESIKGKRYGETALWYGRRR